jgi:hypothetical protein
VDWIHDSGQGPVTGSCENSNELSGSIIKGREYVGQVSNYQLPPGLCSLKLVTNRMTLTLSQFVFLKKITP